MRLRTGLLAGVLATAAASSPWVADRGDGTYQNPVLYADYSDPDVVRVGRDFYLTASSFNQVPGLPILHSRDLVNWELVGHALPRLPSPAFDTPQHGKGVWAPAIRYHDGRFWIYYPDPDSGIWVVTAPRATGPWSEPRLVKGGKGLIDPCPLWDDDGQVYLVHAWARSRAGFANVLTLNRLTPDGLHAADEGHVIIDGSAIPGYATLEGPKAYKHRGEYWIFAPAGGVQRGWQSVFRARSIEGPYANRIVLTQGSTDVNGPHQGAWIDTPSGQDWFVHFQDHDVYGRVIRLEPMAWRADGWPVLGDDPDGDGTGEPVRGGTKPDVPPQRVLTPATSDEFGGPRLGLQWQWEANPSAAWLSLDERKGWLRLYSQRGPASMDRPNLLLQKWPAPAFTATAAVRAHPMVDGERAVLIVFGRTSAWIGVQRIGEMLQLVRGTAESGAGDALAPVAPLRPGIIVYLRVIIHEGGRCTFSYSTDGRTYHEAADPFVATPGIWVGAKVGLAATAPAGKGATGYSDWDWFRITAAPAGGGPLAENRR